MKPYSSIIHTVLIIIIFLCLAFFFFKISSLEELLLSKGFTSENLDKVSLQNLNDSNLSIIFTFIGVIFALFSFLTFQGIKDFYESKISEVKKEYEENKKSQKEQEQRFNNLMIEFYTSEAFSNTDDFHKQLDFGNYEWYIYHLFGTISYYALAHEIKSENNLGDSSRTLNVVNNYLDAAIKKLNNVDEVFNVKDESITKYIQNIRKFNSMEIDKKVMLIYNKLN